MGSVVIWSCLCAASSAYEVCLLIALGLCRAVQEYADKAGRPGAEESYRAAQACGAACVGSKRELWGGRRPGEGLNAFANTHLLRSSCSGRLCSVCSKGGSAACPPTSATGCLGMTGDAVTAMCYRSWDDNPYASASLMHTAVALLHT